MPPTKQAPPRFCGECGLLLTRKRYNGRLEDFGVFQRRKFCDTRCMARNFDARPSRATSEQARTGNYHARKIIPPGPCSLCGKPKARDIHHMNGDRNDNRQANLTRLCRGCHLRSHRYASQPRSTRAATTAASAPSPENTSCGSPQDKRTPPA